MTSWAVCLSSQLRPPKMPPASDRTASTSTPQVDEGLSVCLGHRLRTRLMADARAWLPHYLSDIFDVWQMVATYRARMAVGWQCAGLGGL